MGVGQAGAWSLNKINRGWILQLSVWNIDVPLHKKNGAFSLSLKKKKIKKSKQQQKNLSLSLKNNNKNK